MAATATARMMPKPAFASDEFASALGAGVGVGSGLKLVVLTFARFAAVNQ